MNFITRTWFSPFNHCHIKIKIISKFKRILFIDQVIKIPLTIFVFPGHEENDGKFYIRKLTLSKKY